MKAIRFWLPALAVLIVACGSPFARQRYYSVDQAGKTIDVTPVTSALSCTGISLPQRPSQANINIAKALLPAPDAAALQILYEEFKELVANGVHSLSGKYGGT